MDSSIHLLNNWGLDCKINRKCKHLINFHHFLLLAHTAYDGRLQRSLTSNCPGVKIVLVRCYILVLRGYRFLAIVHVGVSRQNFDFIKVFHIFVLILAELVILINKFSGNIMDYKALLNSKNIYIYICQQFVNTSFGLDLSSNILTYHLCSLTN